MVLIMIIERESTYLLREFPIWIENCTTKETIDHYLPADSVHPLLRVRKQGNKLELTKKIRDENDDDWVLQEYNTPLYGDEYEVLSSLPNKTLHKIRYYYEYNWHTLEIDVFKWALEWLVLVDIEFDSPETMKAFIMPEFCLADITWVERTAWGMLCGKSYEDIQDKLERYWYEKKVV